MQHHKQPARRQLPLPARSTERARSPCQEYRDSASGSRLNEVLDLVNSDYAQAQRRLQRWSEDVERSVRKLSYVAATAAFALAAKLYEDDAAWERFKTEKALARHAKLDREHCLRYALMYMYGSMIGTIAARACDHARKLEGLWSNDASARDVYRALCEHGFSGLERGDSAPPAPGRNGPPPRPIQCRSKVCRKLDALAGNQFAILIIKKVSTRGKYTLRGSKLISDSEVVAAVREKVDGATRKEPIAPRRGRR